MINRRTLRIKAMQELFAYKQCIEANYHLAEEFLIVKFSPDLNSMEVQNHALLKVQQKKAVGGLRKMFNRPDKPKLDPEASPDTEQAIIMALKNFDEACSKDFRKSRLQLSEEVDRIYALFVLYFNLVCEFHKAAEKSEKIQYRNFVNNLLIKGIRLNKKLQNATLANKFRWDDHSGTVKEWFRNIIVKDEAFIEYNALSNTDFEEDRKFLDYLIKKVIFGDEVINDFQEDMDLHWTENRPIIKSLIIKSIGNITEETPSEFLLQELSYNLEEDKEFFLTLFEKVASLKEEHKQMIAIKAENWDVERLAVTDRVILEMAIAEMINFPGIPVKVTINEYIEVSKKYSTPKSKLFINGMLDVIADELVKNGVIQKSGRGLIDNK